MTNSIPVDQHLVFADAAPRVTLPVLSIHLPKYPLSLPADDSCLTRRKLYTANEPDRLMINALRIGARDARLRGGAARNPCAHNRTRPIPANPTICGILER